jgi:segregation and condensation protein A
MVPETTPSEYLLPEAVHPYTVLTTVYEGPLDLLLQLIERAELDITSLALAQVTDQYLEHLHHLTEGGTESALYTGDVSAFLVIAARLIQIKSEALLPRPPIREIGVEDAGEALAKQLVTYKRFKEMSEILGRREAAGLRTYPHLAPLPPIEGNLDLSGLTLVDLLTAAQLAFTQIDPRPSLSSVVAPPRITIREKIHLIASYLRRYRHASFDQLVGQSLAAVVGEGGQLHVLSRLDIVVTFLAMLELVKRSMIEAQQEHLFGKIELEPTESFAENVTFELEFGE